jgi:hypothetical protein
MKGTKTQMGADKSSKINFNLGIFPEIGHDS